MKTIEAQPITVSGGGVVGFHIGVPNDALTARLFPLGNRLAPCFLARILTLALSLDALLEVNLVPIQGTMEDAIGLLATRRPAAAIEIIKAELSQFGLLPFVKIAVMTPAGWECVFPGPDAKIGWWLDRDRLAPGLEKHAEFLAACETFVKFFGNAGASEK